MTHHTALTNNVNVAYTVDHAYIAKVVDKYLADIKSTDDALRHRYYYHMARALLVQARIKPDALDRALIAHELVNNL